MRNGFAAGAVAIGLCAATVQGQFTPLNDECDGAEALSVPAGGSVDINASTTDATEENPVPPLCGTSIAAAGVWYSVIGNGNTMTASTCNQADYDTKINIYCNGCDDFTCVTGVDDTPGCGGFTTELSWCAADGAEYLILVQGFSGDTGNFTLTVSDDGVACTPTVVCGAPELGCGDLGTGDCFDSNGTPFCNEATCCNLVCDQDPSCCDTAWDAGCVLLAETLCPPEGTLSLEFPNPGACQVGDQLVVDVWMRDVTGTLVQGYQAFVEFDETVLTYNEAASSYNPDPPFDLHIIPIDQVDDLAAGELYLDGSVNFNEPGTSDDTLLATLVFDVDLGCQTSSMEFFHSPPFFSELSYQGIPVPTKLSNLPLFTLDGEDPVLENCPADTTIECDVDPTPDNTGGSCTATDNCGNAVVTFADKIIPSATSNCCEAHGGVGCDDPECEALICGQDAFCCDNAWDGICRDAALAQCEVCTAGDCPEQFTIVRTWTATDACGNTDTHVQTIEVVDTTAPVINDGEPLAAIYLDWSDVGTCQADINPADPPATDNCAEEVSFICERWIGTPLSNCCYPNGGQGCDNMDCQIAVCTELPLCCTQEWDNTCAANAESQNCVALCDIPGEIDIAECDDPYDCGVEYTLRWIAVDPCGNESAPADQPVFVECVNRVNVDISLVGVAGACTRCLHLVADDCSFADVEVAFDENGDFSGTLDIPCGLTDFLCIKDEQHTLFDSTGLMITGDKYTADDLVELRGGDTDNDSDCDINDVTWLVVQFGEVAADGDCPWDGTRDADFNCSGDVDSIDYTIMSAQWLQFTTCGCVDFGNPAAPATWIPIADLDPAIANIVNLNGDAVFDHRDVALFEQANGLPNTLSSRMNRIRPNVGMGGQSAW